MSDLSFAALSCRAQTCPSYEVGESNNLGLASSRTPSRNTVYINTVSTDSAPCAGMVYGWRLCSHSFTAPASVQLSMYRRGDGNSYQLVDGSVYELTLQSSISSYTCLDMLLDGSEYFSVEQGDMVAACWNEDGSTRVENFRRALVSLVSGGSCFQAVINEPGTTPFRKISLSAYISECSNYIDYCIYTDYVKFP